MEQRHSVESAEVQVAVKRGFRVGRGSHTNAAAQLVTSRLFSSNGRSGVGVVNNKYKMAVRIDFEEQQGGLGHESVKKTNNDSLPGLYKNFQHASCLDQCAHLADFGCFGGQSTYSTRLGSAPCRRLALPLWIHALATQSDDSFTATNCPTGVREAWAHSAFGFQASPNDCHLENRLQLWDLHISCSTTSFIQPFLPANAGLSPLTGPQVTCTCAANRRKVPDALPSRAETYGSERVAIHSIALVFLSSATRLGGRAIRASDLSLNQQKPHC